MKTIFRILPVLTLLVLSSCSKEVVNPATPGATTSMVHVEYRVSAQSGHMTVYQLVPTQGAALEEKVEVNRTTYTYSFDVISGTPVRVTATNTTPSPDEVIAEIYVNDVLLTSASANAPGADALAEGIAQ